MGKYSIMAEISSTVFMIGKFVKMGISNITILLNKLTSLTLGTYRGSEYHDHTNQAVVKMIEKCVNAAKDKNITVSVARYLSTEMKSICTNIGPYKNL